MALGDGLVVHNAGKNGLFNVGSFGGLDECFVHGDRFGMVQFVDNFVKHVGGPQRRARQRQTSLAQWGGRGGGQKSQGSEENGLHYGRAIEIGLLFICFLTFARFEDSDIYPLGFSEQQNAFSNNLDNCDVFTDH